MYIFLTHSSSGNFAETWDGLESRGADRHRVSPNHPKFHQNSPRAVDEWGNELSYAIAAFHSAGKHVFAVENGLSLLFWSSPKKEEFFRHQKRKCLKWHRKT